MPPFPDHDGPYSTDVNQNKPLLSSLSCSAQHFVTTRRTATKIPRVVRNLKWLAEGHHRHCHTTLSLSSSPPSHCLAGRAGITQNCREPAEAPSPQQPTEKASPGTSKQPGFLNKALLFSHFFVLCAHPHPHTPGTTAGSLGCREKQKSVAFDFCFLSGMGHGEPPGCQLTTHFLLYRRLAASL